MIRHHLGTALSESLGISKVASERRRVWPAARFDQTKMRLAPRIRCGPTTREVLGCFPPRMAFRAFGPLV